VFSSELGATPTGTLERQKKRRSASLLLEGTCALAWDERAPLVCASGALQVGAN